MCGVAAEWIKARQTHSVVETSHLRAWRWSSSEHRCNRTQLVVRRLLVPETPRNANYRTMSSSSTSSTKQIHCRRNTGLSESGNNDMADPLGLGGDTFNASRHPYIAIVINSTAFSIPQAFVKEGLTGGQKLMRSLKEEARKTYGGPQYNRYHHHQTAVHIEIIADKETWKALFASNVDFIDGCNGDNRCRISYHADFTKVAEGEDTVVHIGILR